MRTQSPSPDATDTAPDLSRYGPASICRYVSPRELIALLGVSEATIWRLRRRGELPEPVRLSPGRVAWSERTIADWLARRADR